MVWHKKFSELIYITSCFFFLPGCLDFQKISYIKFRSPTTNASSSVSPVMILGPLGGSHLTDNTPTVFGTAEPFAMVQVIMGGGSCLATANSAGNWMCDISPPLTDGNYSISATQNVSGVISSPVGTGNVFVDTTPPTVSLSGPSGVTNLSPIPITITFDEEMNPSTIGLSDFAITNGSASNLNCTAVGVNPTVCTIDVTPISDGLVTVNMAANVADDLAGNDNTAATPLSVTYDGTAPSSPVIDQPANGSATNDDTPTVSGLPGSAEPGATVTASVGSVQCTALVAADGSWSCAMPTSIGPEGSYTVTAFQTDSLGNVSSAGSHSFMLDTTAPSVALTTSASSPTNSNPIPVTATFSEEMNPSTIGLSDFAITNGSASNLNCTAVGVNPTVCTIDVTPTADGAVTVNMAANVADDLAGNDNTAATPLSVTYDGTAPSSPVIDQPANGSATNDNTPTVSGLPGSAEPGATVTASVGSVQCTALVAADGSWSCAMPTSIGPEGSYTVTAFQTDSLGNVSSAGSHSFMLDTTAPSVTLTTSASSPTNSNPIPVTATFSEEMNPSTIGLSDFAITNGTASNLNCTAVGVNPTVCTIDVTPTADGAVTVNMAANVADDLAGNDNTAATPLSVTYDGTAPSSPVIDQPANGSATNDNTPTVSGLPGSAEPGATVTASVGSVQCTALVAADGSWSCAMPTSIGPEGSYTVTAFQTDSLGNISSAGSHSFMLDTTAPSVTLTTSASSPTNSNPIPVTATFSEEMNPSTIGLSDFAITNGSASNLNCTAVGVNPTVCTIDVTPISDGLVTVNMAANVVDDLAGNDNTAATQLSVTSDTSVDDPIIVSPAAHSNVTENFNLVVTCPEVGSVLTVTEDSLTPNPTIHTCTTAGDETIAMTFVSGTTGTHYLDVVATDTAGNTSNIISYPVNVFSECWVDVTPGVFVGEWGGDLSWGDYDGDGDLDLVTTGAADSSVLQTRLYRNNGGGSFADVTPASFVDLVYSALAWADYDGDGDLDLVTSGRDSGFNHVIYLYRNDGGGSFTDVTPGSFVGQAFSDLSWGDYDGDGDLDLVVSGYDAPSSHAIYLYRNDGGGAFTDVTPPVFVGQSGTSLSWGDYDGDGDLDLIASGHDSSSPSIYLYRNDGGGSFTDVTPGIFMGQSAPSLSWADYDGDGDLDLVTSGFDTSYDQSIYLYQNDGGGTFIDVTPAVFVGQRDSDLSWGDFDGDGDLDLVVSGYDASFSPSIYLYRNEGGDIFTDVTPGVFVGQWGGALSWGDYDGDGDLDLVSTGSSGVTPSHESIYLYQNQCTGASTVNATISAPTPQINAGNETVYTFTGTCSEISEEVRVIVGGLEPSPQPLCQAGGVYTTPSVDLSSLPDGTYNVQVLHCDSTGNNCNSEIIESVIKDTIVPLVVQIDSPSDGSVVGDLSPTVSGSLGEPGLTVTVTSGSSSCTSIVDGSGNWSCDLAPDLAQGGTTITAVQMDAAGNVSPSDSHNVTIDAPPSVVVSSTASDPTNVTPIPVTATFSEEVDVSTIALSDFTIGNGTASNLNCTAVGVNPTVCTFDMAPAANGAVTVDVAANQMDDLSGNGNLVATQFSITYSTLADPIVVSPVAHATVPLSFNLVVTCPAASVNLTITNSNLTPNPTTHTCTTAGDETIAVVFASGTVGTQYMDVVASDGVNTSNTISHPVMIPSTCTGVTWADVTPIVFVGQHLSALEWGDYDGDGDVDLVTSGVDSTGSTALIYLYRNDGGGNFSDQTPSVFVPQRDGALAWGDYDGDGDADLVATGMNASFQRTVYLYRNDGGGNFSDQTPGVFMSQGHSDLMWGDYDGDGDLDLVGMGTNAGGNESVYLYRNDGGGSFSDQTPPAFVGQRYGDLEWSDYDGDLDLDLVVTGYDTSNVPQVHLYRNDGGGSFSDQTPSVFEGQTYSSLAWGDYDGDGDADLVATGMNASFQSTVYLYRNDGGGNFSDQTPGVFSAVRYAEVEWGDYDKDGDLDLALSGFGALSTYVTDLYRNDGGGSFSDQTPAAFVGHANSALSWGDYDGDGDIDLVTNGYDSSATAIMHLYENQCAGASAVTATIDAPTPQINAGNETAYTFTGTCSEIGEEVRVLVGGIAPASQPLCQSGGVYVVPTTDVSSLADGPHDVQVLHCNTAGNDCITEIIVSVTKDSIPPAAVVITAPTNGSTINDATPTVSGTGEIGATVNVSSGGSSCTAVVDGSGNWTCDMAPFLVDGTHSISATQTDMAGNTSPTASVSVTIDALPFVTSITSIQSDPTNANPIDISVAFNEVMDLSSIVLSDFAIGNGTASNLNCSGSPTTCTFDIAPAADGNVTVDVAAGVALDLGGNGNLVATQFTITSDTTVADPVVVSPAAGSTVSLTFNLTVTCPEVGAVISVSNPNVTPNPTTHTCITAGNETIAVVFASGTTGSQTLAVVATDGAGNTSSIVNHSLNVSTGCSSVSWNDVTPSVFVGQYDSALAWGDYDGDGDEDLVASGSDSGAASIYLYRNDGGGVFVDVTPGVFVGQGRGDLSWGDYDGDGDLDLVASGRNTSSNPTIYLYRNDGGGVFVDVTPSVFVAQMFSALAWGDYDGDGDEDLVASGIDTGGNASIYLYRNDGGGVFVDVTPSVFVGQDSSALAWGDYDGDGDEDLVASGSASIYLYRNDGGGVFVDVTPGVFVGEGDGDLSWGDYDGDGDEDLVASGIDTGGNASIYLYRNDGGGVFVDVTPSVFVGQSSSALAWGDYDGDGDADLVASGYTSSFLSSIYLYENDGVGGFTDVTPGVFVGQTFSALTWGDYDGDGDIDLVASGYNNSAYPSIYLYENVCTP